MLPLPNWVRIVSVALFFVSFVGGMALVSWHEAAEARGDTLLETLVAIIVNGESVSIVSAAIAGAFEGGAFIVVIAYEMVKRGFDRGHAQGVEEGSKKAYADADRQIAAYYKRMQEAKERGEEFNEPPPRFTDQQGQDDD